MIITKIQGGLGNQMFQYALGKAQAIRNGIELKVDVSKYGTSEEPRAYQLMDFNITSTVASSKDLHYLGIPPWHNKGFFFRLRRKIFRVLETRKPLIKQRIFMEPYVPFCPEILKTGKNVLFIGDWQSEKYFKDIAEIIRNEFSLKIWGIEAQKIRDQITNEVRGIPVSIHIRRGDKVSVKKFANKYVLPSIEYYISAGTKIAQQIGKPVVYYIFSDDVEWVKENLQMLQPAVIVSRPGLRDAEDISLMSSCHHNITANSSFSWWGAWLNKNPNKIVVAPKKIFSSDALDDRDLIPESWVRI